jgi:hypothetical protein
MSSGSLLQDNQRREEIYLKSKAASFKEMTVREKFKIAYIPIGCIV